VRIGFVAIHALLEYERFLEISVEVALRAIDAGVLAFKRELGLGMIEALVHGLERNLLPSAGTVARLAALREAPMVRIFVTIGTLIEGNTNVLRFAVGSIHVAISALYLRMQASQRITGLRVIKLGLTGLADIDRLPVREIVALKAILAEAALVLILVAADATRRQTEVSAAWIFDLDGRTFLRGDARWVVALAALQARVLAFEQVSGFLVIERLGIPLDQREVFPVMLRVASGTFLAGAGRDVVGGVQAFASRKPGGNFGVTVQTFQCRLAAKFVTTGAFSGSVQRLVRPRERSRRDLPPSRGQQHDQTCQPKKCNDAEPQRGLWHCLWL